MLRVDTLRKSKSFQSKRFLCYPDEKTLHAACNSIHSCMDPQTGEEICQEGFQDVFTLRSHKFANKVTALSLRTRLEVNPYSDVEGEPSTHRMGYGVGKRYPLPGPALSHQGSGMSQAEIDLWYAATKDPSSSGT
jgi:hypothetical protein